MEKKAVYYCEICGNVVEGLWDCGCNIICCETEMKKLTPNTTDAAQEKHVPVIERNGNEVTVKVGSVAHPMDKDHYILFIEVIDGDKVLRHDFKEGDSVAQATFTVSGSNIEARAFCNKHGFWASK